MATLSQQHQSGLKTGGSWIQV